MQVYVAIHAPAFFVFLWPDVLGAGLRALLPEQKPRENTINKRGKGYRNMKRGIWRKLVSAALAVGMVLTCAATSVLAAEPDSVQEFRQGTVKMAGQADFNGLGLMMVLKDNGDLWALGNLSFLGKDAPYDEIKTIDRGDEKETVLHLKKL